MNSGNSAETSKPDHRLSWQHFTTPMLCKLFVSALLAIGCSALSYGQGAGSTIADIESALRAHDSADAMNRTRDALVKAPNDCRLWTLRGMAYSEASKPVQAFASFRQALKLSPGYLPALEGAAEIAFHSRNDEAMPLLKQILEQHPDDSMSHAMMGVLEFNARNCSGAVAHFRRAEAALSGHPDALSEFGFCLATLGAYEEAIGTFEQVLAADLGAQGARYNLALAFWKTNRAPDALEALKPLIDGTPQDIDSLILAADIAESQNDTPNALKYLRMAILANPKRPDGYLDLAYLSFTHGSERVGVDVLNAGLEQLPDCARMYLARGILFSKLGEYEKAEADFDAANRLEPAVSIASVAEGILNSQKSNPRQALASFRSATKKHPDDALAQYLLAEAIMEEGKVQGSAEYREEVTAAERAAKLEPRLVAAHDLLASIYLQNGRTALAIRESQAALAVDPTDQQAVYHMILALRKTNQPDQIRTLVKRLIALRTKAEAQEKNIRIYPLYERPSETTASGGSGSN